MSPNYWTIIAGEKKYSLSYWLRKDYLTVEMD
jgi:hypothetical protein